MIMDKVYDPKKSESKWYDDWLKARLFHADENSKRPPYCIVIPPPNVTGYLHMGHALNNTVQDILIRYKSMKGLETLWLPGTDHAGIATQNVVERMLKKQGISRHDLGREAFLEKVWEWKDKYGSRIIEQLKRLGCACDWERERFTLDEGLSRAVMEVFVHLYNKGLIYRGNYIINWCPRCQTALSDEESEHEELSSRLYYIRYPVVGSEDSIIVATTRPETMLGDTAVAINPTDERYKHLVGKKILLPLMNKEIPVIEDDFVSVEFGTGIVKVTPYHDPNDFEMAQRHNLPGIVVIDKAGRMNENAGDYKGMDRFKARNEILRDLEKQGYLEKIEKYRHSVGHCYRCKTVLEPYLSEQWFVKMKPLAEPAIKAVKEGRIRFYPSRWTKVYLDWMENIRDWCISRQLWWGHRIPVWYCDSCRKMTVAVEPPERCAHCGSQDINQDEDVLDTWFSSWLWPFSTMGWPENTKTLRKFYPTSTLVTAFEILFFWVARMIMAGLEFMGEIPYRDVYIHGIVRDAAGKKMSKSYENSIDPLDMIEKYGTDALRFSLLLITPVGQDVLFSEDKIEIGRNFCNKIWNASRLLLMNLEGFEQQELDVNNITPYDRWILSRFNRILKNMEEGMDAYRLNEVAMTIYKFFWDEFCDWYLEFIKPIIYKENQHPARMQTLNTAITMLNNAMKVLHPFMPFITEEIWQHLPEAEGFLMKAPYPSVDERLIDPGIEEEISLVIDVIRAARTMRTENNIKPQIKAPLIINSKNKSNLEILNNYRDAIIQMVRLESLDIRSDVKKQSYSATTVVRDIDIYLPLRGLVDVDTELSRLHKQLDKIEKEIEFFENKLAKKSYVNKAPAELVEKDRQKLQYQREKEAKIRQAIHVLRNIRQWEMVMEDDNEAPDDELKKR